MKQNKTLLRNIGDIIIYLAVFFVVQTIVTLAGGLITGIVNGTDITHALSPTSPVTLALTSVFSSVITFIVFMRAHWCPISRTYLASKPWFSLFWVVLFTLGYIIPATYLSEVMGIEESEQFAKLFESLMKEPWGYVAIGIMAPLAEEVVFRGAILRKLLEMMGHHWRWGAIFISAVIFGLVHGNAAQFFNAFILGIVLGWMYYRTKSIVPGILLHWVNNSVVYVLANLLPTGDKLIDIFKGNQQSVYMAVGFSLCILIPSLYQMAIRLTRAKE